MLNNKNNHLKLIKTALLLIATSLLPLTSYANESPPKEIRITGQGNPYGTPYGTSVIGVLKEQHYLEQEFAKEGVNIVWQFPQGTGPAINEAIANGQIDFANYGGLPNIVGRGSGLKTKILASYGNDPVYVVARKGLTFNGLQDLKGKKVAVARGTILELSLATLLKQAGLTSKDIELFDLKSADQIAAISSGDVDVVVGTSSLLVLPEKGLGTLAYTTKGKFDAANLFGSFLVTQAFADQYPETTQRVVTAFVKAAAYSSDEANRKQVIDTWALTKVPRNNIEQDYQGDLLKNRLSPLIDAYYLANLQRGIDFAKESKLIRRDVDITQWVDSHFIEKAIKDLGYQTLWTPRNAQGIANE